MVDLISESSYIRLISIPVSVQFFYAHWVLVRVTWALSCGAWWLCTALCSAIPVQQEPGCAHCHPWGTTPPCPPSAFVHRCGRTARIGHGGSALVFLLPMEEAYINFLAINQKVSSTLVVRNREVGWAREA